MNGAHDLGGMHGFGPIGAEPDEPMFHSDWERRAFGLTLAMGAWRRWNIDMSRFAREQMPPAEYLATSYYEHWMFGLERLLVEKGFVSAEEMARLQRGELTSPAPADAREDRAMSNVPSMASASNVPIVSNVPGGSNAPSVSNVPGVPKVRDGALRPDGVPRMLRNRRAARLDDAVSPCFQVGQSVLVRNLHPVGHTRAPRYIRGRRGVITIDHGVFIFPDTHAAGLGTKPQHVYSVRFSAQELWGPEAPARDSVYVDLWDDYLEAAP